MPDLWEVVNLIVPILVECDRWLHSKVVGFVPPGKEDRLAIAWRLAVALFHPEHRLEADGLAQINISCEFNALCDGYETLIRGPGNRYELVPAGANSVWSSPEGFVQLDGPERQEFHLAKLVIVAGDSEVTVPNGRATLLRLRQQRTATASAPALTLWECTCGTGACWQDHRIVNWNPDHFTLPAFVASAIKGPDTELNTGVFKGGMYYALLSREGLL